MTDDGNHAYLIGKILDQVKPRKIVRKVIEAAYAAGYEKHSDGITLMSELAFASLKMKHPAGVGHDWLYYMGLSNPFLPARRSLVLAHHSLGVGGGEDGPARRSHMGEDGPSIINRRLPVNSDWQARLWADNWFSDALKDFGHPIRARLWWLGLRIGAWRGWHIHRANNHPIRRQDCPFRRHITTCQ